MRLHEQVKQQARIILAYEQGINELQSYMNSSKFHFDTTVQVGDVNSRLIQLRLDVWKAED